MPKSKIRSRGKLNHYNEHKNLVVGKNKQLMYGKGESNKKIKKRSKYLGALLTPTNVRKYTESQKQTFISKYSAAKEKELQALQEKEGTTAADIAKMKGSIMSDRALQMTAYLNAKYQIAKERNHYKAWLKGRDVYTYKGQTFPVLTEQFISETKSIKDIVNIGEDGTRSNPQ